MREVLAVARACGATLADDTVQQAMASLDRGPATGNGKMKDVLAGRPSELETEAERSYGGRRSWASKSPAMSSCTPVCCHRNGKRAETSSSRSLRRMPRKPRDNFDTGVHC
jgi:hypothetical protein